MLVMQKVLGGDRVESETAGGSVAESGGGSIGGVGGGSVGSTSSLTRSQASPFLSAQLVKDTWGRLG